MQDKLNVYFAAKAVYTTLEVDDMLEFEKGFVSVNKTFRIPVDMVEQLNSLAGEYNTSVNKIVIQCLQYALANIGADSKAENEGEK